MHSFETLKLLVTACLHIIKREHEVQRKGKIPSHEGFYVHSEWMKEQSKSELTMKNKENNSIPLITEHGHSFSKVGHKWRSGRSWAIHKVIHTQKWIIRFRSKEQVQEELVKKRWDVFVKILDSVSPGGVLGFETGELQSRGTK